MKKLGLLIFIVAIAGSIAIVWAITGKTLGGSHFLHFGVTGSGKIISEKRDVKDFKSIDAGGAMQLDVKIGNEFSVTIEADDNVLPLIKTEVRGGVLYFERSEGRISTRNNVKAQITMPELAGLDLSGASQATISGVKTDKLDLDASGASKIEITGEARESNIKASGASRITATNLKTEKTTVKASGASRADVFASEAIEADANGASRITYSGSPKIVNKDASGASSVSGN